MTANMKRRNIVVMVKPASSLCNLRCTYCFYHDEAKNREEYQTGIMKEDTVRNLITKFSAVSEQVSFLFQGGEPTIAGLDFFRHWLELEKEISPETHYYHAFQTNGMVIDDEWAEFFHDNNILVGVSFDGGSRIHDAYRVDAEGNGSARKVLEAVEILKKHIVEFNILMVVTKLLAENVDYVWRFLLRHELYFHQYIPCMDPLGGELNDFNLDDRTYCNFLKRLFDLWFDALRHGLYVSVRLFDNEVMMLDGSMPESCELCGRCSIEYVSEGDGTIYPCDFFCIDEWRLGNINDGDVAKFDRKRSELGYIERSLQDREGCMECPAYVICRGGCQRYRKDGKYLFCKAIQDYYEYAGDRLWEVRAMMMRMRQQQAMQDK